MASYFQNPTTGGYSSHGENQKLNHWARKNAGNSGMNNKALEYRVIKTLSRNDLETMVGPILKKLRANQVDGISIEELNWVTSYALTVMDAPAREGLKAWARKNNKQSWYYWINGFTHSGNPSPIEWTETCTHPDQSSLVLHADIQGIQDNFAEIVRQIPDQRLASALGAIHQHQTRYLKCAQAAMDREGSRPANCPYGTAKVQQRRYGS